MPLAPAIYHPYLHITAEHWISTAALYWDKMIRITTAGIRPHDSPAVRALNETLDLFRTWTVDGSKEKVTQAYTELIQAGLCRNERWAQEIVGRLPVERTSAKTFRLFQVQSNPELVELLRDLGVAEQSTSGWWATTRRLADAYMEVYCACLAVETNSDLLTDQLQHDASISQALLGWPTAHEVEHEIRLDLEIPALTFDPSSIISPETLGSFRMEHANTRRMYCRYVGSASDRLAQATCVREIEETLHQLGDGIRAALNQYRRGLRRLGHKPFRCRIIVSSFPHSARNWMPASQQGWSVSGITTRTMTFKPGKQPVAEKPPTVRPRSWVLLLNRPRPARGIWDRLRGQWISSR